MVREVKWTWTPGVRKIPKNPRFSSEELPLQPCSEHCFLSSVTFTTAGRQSSNSPCTTALIHYLSKKSRKKNKINSPPFQWDLYKWQKMVKMDRGDKGMSSMQNCSPTYCEAVCILSKSERQSLEKKKERKERHFTSEKVCKNFVLVLIHWILLRWTSYNQHEWKYTL